MRCQECLIEQYPVVSKTWPAMAFGPLPAIAAAAALAARPLPVAPLPAQLRAQAFCHPSRPTRTARKKQVMQRPLLVLLLLIPPFHEQAEREGIAVGCRACILLWQLQLLPLRGMLRTHTQANAPGSLRPVRGASVRVCSAYVIRAANHGSTVRQVRWPPQDHCRRHQIQLHRLHHFSMERGMQALYQRPREACKKFAGG
mmetsp:Transcript_74487/g.147523  ORF Transcript_74487/g.147523 Transcript_74487/m.147523 type:complete len:200 (-) Transcript_74487:1018-1617(-)